MFKISGTVDAGEGMMVYLKREVKAGKFLIEDSVEVKNGTFLLSGKIEQVDKRLLVLGMNEVPILLDEVPIEVQATQLTDQGFGKANEYKLKIAGSSEQTVFRKGKELEKEKNFLGLKSMVAMMEVQGDTVKMDSTLKAWEVVKKEIDKNVSEFVRTNNNSVAITHVIGDFIIRNYPLEVAECYYNILMPDVKASYSGYLLRDKIEGLKVISLGGMAPDIDLCGPDGKTIKLSSLRGKYVLLDFWASWCSPCLAELPNVKAVYEQYKDKGFEVYGVSLDSKKDAWVKAIKKHELPWIHVSSLKGWACPVAECYKVTGIPRMFLLDKEGRVMATDLHGETLKVKVASLFENEQPRLL